MRYEESGGAQKCSFSPENWRGLPRFGERVKLMIVSSGDITAEWVVVGYVEGRPGKLVLAPVLGTVWERDKFEDEGEDDWVQTLQRPPW